MKKKRKAIEANPLDYHEGLSENQVRIILHEFGFEEKEVNEFSEWMHGQTCPMIPRTGHMGKTRIIGGIWEWDLFRWINHKRKGGPLVWD